jgi:hypothetical protein
MTDEQLCRMLNSGDVDNVLSALFALGGETARVPEDEVFAAAKVHFHHPDADVRRQAIFAVGVHWGRSDLFSTLLKCLKCEDDDYVREALIAAVTRIAKDSPELRSLAVAALSDICVASNLPRVVRALAYVEIRWLLDAITPGERGRAFADPEGIQIDLEWLKGNASRLSAGT